MREILIKQLCEHPDMAQFDYSSSQYFRKYSQCLKMSFGGAYGIEEEPRSNRAMTEHAVYDAKVDSLQPLPDKIQTG